MKQEIFIRRRNKVIVQAPRSIECYDISHLGGTNTVASMVSFVNGLPHKAGYRKFKIRAKTDGDDFMAIREVILRRYGGSLASKLKTPDLVVIDGGAIQLSAALDSLARLGKKLPVIGLAKKLEEIYIAPTFAKGSGGQSPTILRPDHHNKGLQLLQALRDEAHRFALTYQRLLRVKEIGR